VINSTLVTETIKFGTIVVLLRSNPCKVTVDHIRVIQQHRFITVMTRIPTLVDSCPQLLCDGSI